MTSPLFVDVYRGDLGGKPDWSKLFALGAPWHGAIVKATQSTAYPLGWFVEQWKTIRELGRRSGRYGVDWFRGCYHYLDFDEDGAKQAETYLRAVERAGGWDVGDLWPIVDVELGGSTSQNQLASARQIIECTQAFAERCRLATGRDVMLYGNGAMRDRKITDRMGCRWLWLPRYTAKLPAEMYERAGWTRDELVLWQYSGDGVSKLEGYPRFPPGFGEDVQVSALVHEGGLEWLRAHLFAEKPREEAWAIRHPDRGWLIDACAGGAWTGPEKNDAPNAEVYELAVTWSYELAAFQALDAADIPRDGCEAKQVK